MAFNDGKMHYDQSMFRTLSRRILWFPCVLAIACVILPACAAQGYDSHIQEHFLAAQQAQQEGRLDDAAHEYLAVLHLQPGLPEVYANLGLVYYSQAKFEDSAKALATAGKLKPGMRGVSLWQGIDYVRLNRPAQGVMLLREAIRLDPNEKLAQSWLGTALWNAGQLDEALLQLRKAAEQFPDDPDLLFALGEAYGKAAKQQSEQLLEDSSGTAVSDRIYGSVYTAERDWAKAEGHLRRAVERDPRSVEAHLELAETLLQQASLPEVQAQLDLAATLAPGSADVLARSGELLILMDHQAEGLYRILQAMAASRSEALDALGLPVEDSIDVSQASSDLLPLCRKAAEKLEATRIPDHPSPARDVALADLYARLGDNDAAQRAYEQLAKAKQNEEPAKSAHAGSSLAQAMDAVHRHRYDDAEPKLLRWLIIHPRDLSARYELVLVRRQISMVQVARLLAVAPDSYHVHQLLGQLYVDRQEDEKALAEYLKVAAARPNLPDVHFWLGHLYWKHGDSDHAFAELTRQLELDPGHPEANGELGAVLVAEGRAEEAIPHLESAIHSKPDLWPAYPQLGDAYAKQKNYVRAEEVLRCGLAHDHDGAAHYQLARVLHAEGKSAEAAQVFAQVRTIKNENLAEPASGRVDDGAKQ